MPTIFDHVAAGGDPAAYDPASAADPSARPLTIHPKAPPQPVSAVDDFGRPVGTDEANATVESYRPTLDALGAIGSSLASGHAAEDYARWNDPDGSRSSGLDGATHGFSLPAMVASGADAVTNYARFAGDVQSGAYGDNPFLDPAAVQRGAPAMANLLTTMAPGGLAHAEEGAAGIFGGRLSATADHAAADRAEQMLAGGASRDDVWNATGWFRGVDGKMRYEIPDDAADLRPALQGIWASNPDTVGQAIDHPELFAAYPGMADARFARTPRGTAAAGSYQPGSSLDRGASPLLRVRSDMTGSEGTSTALHELQHGIQHTEGFATGSNPDRFTRDAWERGIMDPLDQRVRDAMASNPVAADAYRVRNQELDRLQGQYGANWADKVSADDLDQLGKLYDAVDAAPGGDAVLGADWARAAARYQVERGIGFDDWRMGQYRGAAGEVEARNVQARADMTPEERAATPPWETQDTPDEAQTVGQQFGRSDSFNNPFFYRWIPNQTGVRGGKTARFATLQDNGRMKNEYYIHFNPYEEEGFEGQGVYNFDFHDRDHRFDMTGGGGSDSQRIIGTVLDAAKNFVGTNRKVKSLVFTADASEPSRVRLYRTLAKKFAGSENVAEGPISYQDGTGKMHNAVAFRADIPASMRAQASAPPALPLLADPELPQPNALTGAGQPAPVSPDEANFNALLRAGRAT